MKTSTLIRYQWKDARGSLLIFYLITFTVIIFLTATTGVTLTLNGTSIGSSNSQDAVAAVTGVETATAIFLLVVGICSFGEYFHMFLQNGVTRRQTLRSMLLFQIILSGGLAVLDSVIAFVIKIITTQFSEGLFIDLFTTIYENHTDSNPIVINILEKLLFLFLLYLTVLSIGHTIAMFYYRASKAWIIGVSVGVPVFFIIILPLIDQFIYPVSYHLQKFFGFIFSGANSGTPYLVMLFFVLLTCLLSFFRYLFIRRACRRKP